MKWHYAIKDEQFGPTTEDEIVHRIEARTIPMDALVWRPGMDGWEPLKNQPEFATAEVLVPPPLPRLTPPPLPLSEAITPTIQSEPDRCDWRSQKLLDPTLPQGRPWSRFFARVLDILLLGSIVAFLIGVYAEIADPQLSKTLERTNASIFGTLLAPIAFLLNAIIITVFGNSLGKRLFGLKAYPIDPAQPVSFWFNVLRELRVWCFGYALGIPLVSLFTMSSNFSAIKAGEPARYDIGRARVTQRATSKARRAVASIAVIAFVVGLVTVDRLVEAVERRVAVSAASSFDRSVPAPQPSTPSVTRVNWTNTTTGKVVGLPVGWLEKKIEDQPGQKLSLFEDATADVAILLATKEGGAMLTLPTYSSRLDQAQEGSWTNLGRWQETFFADRAIRHRSMRATEDNAESGFIIWKQGSRFWRVLVIDAKAKQSVDPRDYPIVRSLMRSVPVG